MIEAAKQVAVLLLRVDLSLRRWVVQLELLHWVPDGRNLLREQRLEVRPLVALRLALLDARLDARVLGELLPLLLEDGVVLLDLVGALGVDFPGERLKVLVPVAGE